jgi:hypothetical protein
MAKLSASLDVAPVNLESVMLRLITKPSFATLLEEFCEVSAKLDQLKAKKDKLSAEVKTKWLAPYGPKLETADFLCTQVYSHSASLTPEILVKCGVKPSTIEKAKTMAKKPYSYPKVTRKKAVLTEEG